MIIIIIEAMRLIERRRLRGKKTFHVHPHETGTNIHCCLYSSVQPSLAISASIIMDKKVGLRKYYVAVSRKTMGPLASKPCKLPFEPHWCHVEIETKSKTPPVPATGRLVDAEADA